MRELKQLILLVALVLLPALAFGQSDSTSQKEQTGMKDRVRLITLDPGHFHAALVQKQMYEQVDPVVHVYAPQGDDLQQHLARIESFNSRPENPTNWKLKVYTGPDFLEQMLRDRAGNVVVTSGNNARKTEYIAGAVNAGLNVLSDKPMAINPDDFELLVRTFKVAREKGVLLYDTMPERYEITNILQRELARNEDLFGTLTPGTPDQPAVTKESVHHFYKLVAGTPLKRPAWFFDVSQEGEGIVDVTTHLVDLVQWGCFPEQIIQPEADIQMISARRWPTDLTPAQFKQVTGLDAFPDYLARDVKDGSLSVMSNGEFTYRIKGAHAKVSVNWNFQAPDGTGDSHQSIMRGTRATLSIRQGESQRYKPTLYILNTDSRDEAAFDQAVRRAIATVVKQYPGVDVQRNGQEWEVVIPDRYKVGHEAHFSEVTQKYLGFLAQGFMPAWEEPNMIAKYYTIMQAYKAASGGAGQVRWDHQKGKQLSLILDGQTLWTYHYAADNNVPYFHPVNAPGGPTLTNFAPKDHPWHRALWFSWKLINGVNYWEWAQPRKPGEADLDPHGVPAGWTRFTGEEVVQTDKNSARIDMDIHYGTGEKTVLKEKRTIVASVPRDNGSYTLDWQMTFTALDEDVVFDRTPPNKTGGGYAGLSYRAPDSIKQVLVIDSEGRTGLDARGPTSRWIDASGIVDPRSGPVGLAILCHPQNERFPSQWHLWAREGGVYVNPSMLYAEPFTLPAGKSFDLAYRILIHKGAGDPKAIEQEFSAFRQAW